MPLPQTLGRLRQVQRLGSGGFATVWLYRDDQLDSLVAVKALADNWTERADVRDRFLEEARILRRADSDHVVRVYDIGETSDRIPYFVMTYADQGTVAELVADGTQHDLAESVDLVTQAAQGLAVLHAHGVVHRDVKPQNLLLRTDGARRRLLVADLGVAKAVLRASGFTQVVGTPAYMAPEQVHMQVKLDERADVHALGAVAYHLLTGRPARTGDFVSLLTPTLPERPSTYAALPAEVDAVVLRALDPDRDRRWPDVLSFAAALRAAAARQGRQPVRLDAGPDDGASRDGQTAGSSQVGRFTPALAADATLQQPAVAASAAPASRVPPLVWLLAVLVLVAGFWASYRYFS